jgi:hypothetical protein
MEFIRARWWAVDMISSSDAGRLHTLVGSVRVIEGHQSMVDARSLFTTKHRVPPSEGYASHRRVSAGHLLAYVRAVVGHLFRRERRRGEGDGGVVHRFFPSE